MIKIYLVIFLTLSISALAQKNEFEGTISYKIEAHSNNPAIPDDVVRLLYAGSGDQLIVDIKKGYYHHHSGDLEIYFLPDKKRIFYKYSKIDTLFYMDYNSDTTTVTKLEKADEKELVLGHPCIKIRLQTLTYAMTYYFTGDFYIDPSHDSANTVGHLNQIVNQSHGGVWLYSELESNMGWIKHKAISIDEKPIDDKVFELPELPILKFSFESIYSRAYFEGGADGWQNYLKKNLNPAIAAKYVRIPKGRDSAEINIVVQFLVNKNGNISNIEVINKDAPPELRTEAIRIIRDSPHWMAATFNRIKFASYVRQPIIFHISR